MLSDNGLYVQIARVTPKALPLNEQFALAQGVNELKDLALQSAAKVISSCVYPFKPTTVDTPLGAVQCETPPSTQTRFVVVIEESLTGKTIPAVYGKAPAMTAHTNADVPTQYGRYCSPLQCALLECAVQYESARRVIQAKKTVNVAASLRLDRLEANLTNLCVAATQNPFLVSSYIESSVSGLSVSLAQGARPIGNARAMPDDVLTTLAMKASECFTGGPTVMESLKKDLFLSPLRDALRSALPYVLPLNSIESSGLDADQRASVTAGMAAYVAQPAFLLDVLGSCADEIDSVAYSELVVACARRLEDALGTTVTFSTRDVPRSIDEVMFFDAGVNDLPFLRSIHAFYHRDLKPDVSPVTSRGAAQTYMRVHPALINDEKVWKDKRVCVVKLNGVDVTLTYPDFMNQDICYHSSQDATQSAAGVIETYDAVCDFVYASLMQKTQGSLSPERLTQLGIPGITTSTTFVVWAA